LSRELCGFHRVDLGEMSRDAGPAIAFVAAHPHLAARRPKVQPPRILRVRPHRLALDRPPGLLLRQARIETLPAFASVASDIRAGGAVWTRARPHGAAVHGEDPHGFGITRVHHHRKADVADTLRHALADAHPLVGRPIEAIDAAVVLLIQAVRVAGAEADTMGIMEGDVGRVELFDHLEPLYERLPAAAAVPRFVHAAAGHSEIQVRRVAWVDDD